MADVFLSLDEVMVRLNLSRAEVYRQVKDEKLKAEIDGDVPRFAETDVSVFETERDQTLKTLREALDYWMGFYEKRIPEGEPDLSEKEESELLDEERAKILAQYIVTDGMACAATDIYFDPLHSDVRILYRSEGWLRQLGTMAGVLSDLVKAELKALGNLVPQEEDAGFMEGIFTQEWENQTYQIRIKATPTALGEHVHLHFYAEEKAPELAVLGYTPSQVEVMRELLTGQPGVLIAAGASDPQADRHRLGLANVLAAEGRLVVSLEHRLHFQSELLVQLAIDESAGFESVMKTVFGMRPDVVIFDDVRDKVEADAILEAATAGAMVVAQVRSVGFVEAVLYLIDLEISRAGLAQVLLGGVERWALRRLCPMCRAIRESSFDERAFLGDSITRVFEPQGCDVCGDGFMGWTRRFGIWPVDAALADAVRNLERPGPGTPLIEWGMHNNLSFVHAVRSAVIDGEVAVKDVLSLKSLVKEGA